MLQRLRQFLSTKNQQSEVVASSGLDPAHLIWAMGSFCAINRIPFDPEILLKQFPPPYTTETLIHAARALGFRIKSSNPSASSLESLPLPFLAVLSGKQGEPALPTEANSESENTPSTLALITTMAPDRVVYFEAGANQPTEASAQEFATRYAGLVFLLSKQRDAVNDPEEGKTTRAFGFSWFLPDLLKHKKVWRDVLLASLVIQLLALGTPLFTQTIIDKVVVHRTESTLMAVAFGMAVFMIFSALLTWVRQYLVLHTGNRVDAVLAAAVFDHLFKLPPRYFEKRPTGVISARLHGVETIREFIASAAVTLVLDLPFLLIFVGIMFWYSVTLTLIVLALLAVITIVSVVIAPLFQSQLNHQFMLGARNQAFVTEYIAGVETVKSLQMEPQLKSRFSDYLADYLQATFKTRQLANTYNTFATTLEQMMSLMVLVVGAYTVMSSTEFTIGMLVAFQMFAGKLSQPMMRLVGLWQQFQQASLSVKRLGDLMDVLNSTQN